MGALAPSGARSLRRESLFAPSAWRGTLLAGPRSLRALLAGAAVGAVVGGIAGKIAHKWYESSAQLAVIPIEDPTQPGNALEGASATLPRMAAVIQTGAAAEEVIESLGLAQVYRTVTVPQSRAALWSHVVVTSDRRSGIVRITAEDADPKRARDIAFALADCAMRRMAQLWSAGPRAQREKLEARFAEISDALAKAEQEMQRFRERTGIVDFDEQRRGVLPSLGALPSLEVEHARRKRAIDEKAAARDMLFRQIQQLRSAETHPLALINLIDAPIESHVPSRPNRLALLVIGAIVGSGLAWLVERALALRRERRLTPMSAAAQQA